MGVQTGEGASWARKKRHRNGIVTFENGRARQDFNDTLNWVGAGRVGLGQEGFYVYLAVIWPTFARVGRPCRHSQRRAAIPNLASPHPSSSFFNGLDPAHRSALRCLKRDGICIFGPMHHHRKTASIADRRGWDPC
ncbi:hypothetical protein MAPG_00398 [Magnaporthiopsis poae ATCC 64411]|uniref:Uncharacterized protein n=1 Tax=Magnaporthiopsis poae (strain ATCC 64411 / 73-15) TaxID=644358 RepID=A0A0C4DKW6_MAGP6|nr:hypothetical protein MAPG_00398 [Magnaporthiopsis poae ATCC 64411]